MKRFIIKNSLCILPVLFLVCLFFVFYKDLFASNTININVYPFYFMSVTLSIFSLVWSFREKERAMRYNILFVINLLFISALFVICHCCFLSINMNEFLYKSLRILIYILFGISFANMLVNFIYAMILDFKKSEK